MSKQSQSRSVHAPQPTRDRSTPTMLVRRKVVSIDRVEVGQWGKVPDLSVPTESVSVVAHLSDGTTDERIATVTYAAGEREHILETAMKADATDEEVRDVELKLQRIMFRRSAAILGVRAELQKAYA